MYLSIATSSRIRMFILSPRPGPSFFLPNLVLRRVLDLVEHLLATLKNPLTYPFHILSFLVAAETQRNIFISVTS